MEERMADRFREDVDKRLRATLEALAIEKGTTVPEMLAAGAEVLRAARVGSTSDDRTVNNSARQSYRVLSEIEKAQVDSVKELGDMLIGLLHEIGGTDPDGDRAGSRNLALAITHIEDGVMRAVRHITR